MQFNNTQFLEGDLYACKDWLLAQGALGLPASFINCVCPALQAADDTRFTLTDGVIYDSKLRLQWAPATDQSMNHYQAVEYARKLSLAGGGWRLPITAELTSLFDKSKPGNAESKFHCGDFFVWTSELEDSSYARYFIFSSGGGPGVAARDTDLPYIHVLAVRSPR